MTSTKSKEIAEEYISSLSDLTLNSKPLINMLTMLADDNVEHASAIVEAVENHLEKVRPEIKLPVLYLIDSIVKNVSGAYLNLFAIKIVKTFSGVFEKVDETTRSSMWKLRQTWKDVFSPQKLYSLDLRVSSMDPAWPVAKDPPPGIPSGSIHLNPRFLTMSQATPASLVPITTEKESDVDTETEAAMREQLLKKQKELLELQRQKVELELLQAKNSLEQQKRHFDKQTSSFKIENVVPTAHVVPTTETAGKPIAPVVPSQATKQPSKQFPAATASLLKNSGTTNGPKISPANSLLVASARQQISRDPRLKVTSNDIPTSATSELRIGSRTNKDINNYLPENQITTTVLSEQLQLHQQQLLTKQSVTSTIQQQQNKQTPMMSNNNINNIDDDNNTSILSTSNNDNNSNNNDKNFCVSNINSSNSSSSNNNSSSSCINNNSNNNNNNSNTSKDKDSNLNNRSSQKTKDIRINLNSINNNVSTTSTTLTTGLSQKQNSVCQLNSTNIGILSSRNNFNDVGKSSQLRRIDGGRDMKLSNDRNSKNDKSSSSSSLSLSSSSSSSSSSSKNSSRKIGGKSRSKQPQISPNKISKIDRDSSPIRIKDNSDSSSPNSNRVMSSPTQSSKSDLTKNSRKKIGKSRKRSPSPPYRIPRRTSDHNKSSTLNINNTGDLMEEEQSGSLIVSPPHPPTFKAAGQNAKSRNYMRRNKDDNCSSDNMGNMGLDGDDDNLAEVASKDEDLRATLIPLASIISPIQSIEKKEDLDLRVLPTSSGKRPSDHIEAGVSKKSKAEKFDALFGNEDVDLRTLTNPKAGRPPTPPPPVISAEENKASWAKIKTPTKNDRDKQSSSDEKDKERSKDRNKDRISRQRLYNKLSDDNKDRRRSFNDDDIRSNRRSRDNDKSDRSSDRSIEIFMKQAEEQYNQGTMLQSEYHKIIQRCWQMNEEEKLKVAQRKEKEIGSIVWEKNIDIGNSSPDTSSDINHRGGVNNRDNHGHNSGRNGPRWQHPWQQTGPWAHQVPPPLPFNNDFRPTGPWQGPRGGFAPMRPDFNQFSHGFNANMGPRINQNIMASMNGPLMSINTGSTSTTTTATPPLSLPPLPPLAPPPLPPQIPSLVLPPPGLNSMNNINNINNNNLINGPTNIIHSNNSNSGGVNNIHQQQINQILSVQNDITNCDDLTAGIVNNNNSNLHNDIMINNDLRNVPSPDQTILNEIGKDTMKSINIDGVPREIRYYGQTGVVFMSWDDPREIGFQDGMRAILIDDKDTILCCFNEPYKEFIFDNEVHRIRLGAPTRELYIDDMWYECYFGGPPIIVDIGNKKVNIKLEGPPPQVKIGNIKRIDLVVGKINLIINARNMVPIFLDSKPQLFELDGQRHTLEFIDSLKTVLLNGRPFPVCFGGLPKPIIIGDNKHFIRFSILPRGIRAGNIRIMGMKGDSPSLETIERQSINILQEQKINDNNNLGLSTINSLQTFDNNDTNSQDPNDFNTHIKPDLQLDMLSSALSSSMAPSSGLSYQAEHTNDNNITNNNIINNNSNIQNNPILPLKLDMNELFQRLVATGIVPKVDNSDIKKTNIETKKEPEIIAVSFDKPETLKIKQPALVLTLYSGMQCSSCGVRFAPESATKYSQHLDWHFRQNRKERDTARKTHSRPWYYDVNIWTQFEEIEDLEERAQSFFETEKQSADMDGTNNDDLSQDGIIISVPAGNDEDAHCHVCHDAFDTFYNEEKEEWHLKPAVCFEGKNYHPLCLEDHKQSLEKSALALDESMTEMEEDKKDDLDESIDKSMDDETTEETVFKNESEDKPTDESKDELIVENTIADNNAEEIIKDTNTQTKSEQVENENESTETKSDHVEDNNNDDDDISEVEKKVEQIPEIEINITDDTENEPDLMECTPDKVQIKIEPIDITDCEDQPFDFENVVIKTEPIDPEPEPEVPVLEITTVVDTTMTAVTSSIDGNVELESAPATMPSAPSRIKINITKPLVTNNKEPEEPKEKPQLDTVIEDQRPLLPASIKSTLQGRKLAVLPTVEKGQEMSGLCSIM
ncbi:hypothetical protein HCN44_003663 [Aphidius gifuensis]|uniref:CID domain-containing protein n=1 Tax=Aphidius gifuensis TaxID=684658 RepID=A0A835CP68_APHGI|nr:uncharacterized protein LOC122858808 [Aphidius gifuensis]XP_044017903.1 uncharacterized protein LOC122858808 [Aphidius gifuensis]KAF7987800.1 hypothetical protein HCN44_003663 [Aphidius gifuensis]